MVTELQKALYLRCLIAQEIIRDEDFANSESLKGFKSFFENRLCLQRSILSDIDCRLKVLGYNEEDYENARNKK